MSPRKIDGIIFDMDGTLVNLGGFVDWKKAFKEVVDNYKAHDCDTSMLEDNGPSGLFATLDLMYTNLLEEKGKDQALEIQQSAYDILSKYETVGANSCGLMDGCIDILEWLNTEGISLGICTTNSKSAAETALNLQGIRDYFKAVIGRSIDMPMKPDTAQLEKCFEILNVDPKNGMMVGDSHKDVIAGKKLGAYTVGIPVYFTRLDLMKQAGVDVIIENLSELKQVIESF